MAEQIRPVEQLTNCGSGDQEPRCKGGEGQDKSMFAFNPKASEFIPGTGATSVVGQGANEFGDTIPDTPEESLTPTSGDGEVDFQENPGVNPLEFAEDDSEMMSVFAGSSNSFNGNVPKLRHHHHLNPDWIGGSGDSMFTSRNQIYGGPAVELGSEAVFEPSSTVNNDYAGYNNNGLLPLPNAPFPEQVQLTPIYQLIAYAQQPCPSIPTAAPEMVQVPGMNPILQVPRSNPGLNLTSTGRQMISQQALPVPVPLSQQNYRTPRAPYRQHMNLQTLPLLVVRPRHPQQHEPYLPQQRFPVRMPPPSEQNGFYPVHPVPPPHLPQPSAQPAFPPAAPTRGPSPFVTVYIPNVDVNETGGSGDQNGSRSIPSLVPVILPRPT